MVDYKLIGQRLKACRKQSGLTQECVAEMSDITPVYLSKIENGRVKPTLEVYATICSVLQCELGSIFSNATPESGNYQNERIVELFHACAPRVKPIALELLEKLSDIE